MGRYISSCTEMQITASCSRKFIPFHLKSWIPSTQGRHTENLVQHTPHIQAICILALTNTNGLVDALYYEDIFRYCGKVVSNVLFVQVTNLNICLLKYGHLDKKLFTIWHETTSSFQPKYDIKDFYANINTFDDLFLEY